MIFNLGREGQEIRKLITITDIRGGEKLARDVVNNRNQLLVPRDTILSPRIMERLIQAGIDSVLIYDEEYGSTNQADVS